MPSEPAGETPNGEHEGPGGQNPRGHGQDHDQDQDPAPDYAPDPSPSDEIGPVADVLLAAGFFLVGGAAGWVAYGLMTAGGISVLLGAAIAGGAFIAILSAIFFVTDAMSTGIGGGRG